MKLRYLCLFLLCFLGSTVSVLAQQSAKKIKSAADNYYKNEKFAEAYNLYTKYIRLKSPDKSTLLKVGIAAYRSNHLPQSIKYFESILEDEKKPDAEVYYAIANAYHQNGDFKKAIQHYKSFLGKVKFDHSLRESVKNEILRCASGLNLAYADEKAVVENMGAKVNSTGDDFGPVLSPNYDNKLYFSSARDSSTGGLRNEAGYPDEELGNYSTDIYSTIIINGEWTSTTPLMSLLNTPRNEVLMDFNDNGQVMYYYKGLGRTGGEALVDSFKATVEHLYPPKLDTPLSVKKGDSHPYFFNDSTMLFSSNRTGGVGGKDIYITTRENGYWTVPKNLGLAINTAYDEISPFLSKDGRTLYFSSNNPKSIGGMDIYRAKYNDARQTWDAPENMASPVNSPGNDQDFRLSPSGLEGYFASDRKSGLGGFDLLTAYFKSKLYEQLTASKPALFTEVPAFQQRKEMSGVIFESTEGQPAKSYPSTVNFPEEQITTVEVKPIHFRNDDDVLNQINIKQINDVIKLIKQYPQLKIMLTAHSDGKDPADFDLFFSIKRAEKVADYMRNNGINAANIFLKGVGATYPAAMQMTEQGPSLSAEKMNRRIDFEIFNSAGLPLQVVNKGPIVSSFAEDERGVKYNQAIKGLSYKVQIASLSQRYKGNLLMSYADPLIESNFNNLLYKYTVGLFQTFYEAEQLRKELEGLGITDAFIVPYINGVRASRDDSKIYAAAYPDLLNFLSKTGSE